MGSSAVVCAIVMTLSGVMTAIVGQFNDDDWESFKIKHGKFYPDFEEDALRKKNYFNNRRIIESHNKLYFRRVHRFKLEVNKFTDMAMEEFAMLLNGMMGYRPLRPSKLQPSGFWKNMSDRAPSSIDWRDHGVVTPVKNQGNCGACWAFSTTGSLEGQHALKSGQLVSLSEQNLIDCDYNNVNEGCQGGNMDNAYSYVILNDGIDTEESYPYQGQEGQCNYSNNSVGSTAIDFHNLPSGNEEILKDAVGVIGPISVAIDARGPQFQFYKRGIYYNPFCSSRRLTHGVLVVGYGTNKKGDDYWIVKNSWGSTWGDKGYIYMARNKNNNCGIATAASYPIVD